MICPPPRTTSIELLTFWGGDVVGVVSDTNHKTNCIHCDIKHVAIYPGCIHWLLKLVSRELFAAGGAGRGDTRATDAFHGWLPWMPATDATPFHGRLPWMLSMIHSMDALQRNSILGCLPWMHSIDASSQPTSSQPASQPASHAAKRQISQAARQPASSQPASQSATRQPASQTASQSARLPASHSLSQPASQPARDPSS